MADFGCCSLLKNNLHTKWVPSHITEVLKTLFVRSCPHTFSRESLISRLFSWIYPCHAVLLYELSTNSVNFLLISIVGVVQLWNAGELRVVRNGMSKLWKLCLSTRAHTQFSRTKRMIFTIFSRPGFTPPMSCCCLNRVRLLSISYAPASLASSNFGMPVSFACFLPSVFLRSFDCFICAQYNTFLIKSDLTTTRSTHEQRRPHGTAAWPTHFTFSNHSTVHKIFAQTIFNTWCNPLCCDTRTPPWCSWVKNSVTSTPIQSS